MTTARLDPVHAEGDIVRNLLAALAIATLVASTPTPAPAQQLWTPEWGVQGGVARVKPTGTAAADQVDLWDLPGFSFADGMPSALALYGVIPVHDRLALEPSLALADITALLGTSHLGAGLRADVALTAHLYAAAGGTVSYVQASTLSAVALSGTHDWQLGLLAAVGYRVPLTRALRIRFEAQVVTLHATTDLPAANVYALLVGVGAGRRQGSVARGPAEARPKGGWRPVIGLAGGYTHVHLNGGALGGGDFATVALPGYGAGRVSSGFGFDVPVAGPPPLFVVFPVAGRLALEAGADGHRLQSGGQTVTTAQIAPRLDYAVTDHWYAAAGPSVHYVRSTGRTGFALLGAGLAWGYRLPLTHDLQGRLELSYTAYRQRADFPLAANTVSVTAGAMLPL